VGIFGRVPSGGGPATSRKDRRRLGARARSKTVARRETERRAQVFVIAGIVIVAIAILGVLGFGYYQTSIAPKHETVLKVGGRSFNMGYVEKRIRYAIRSGGSSGLASSSEHLAVAQAVTDIENEEITRLNASQQNISVSEDEIDAEIRTELGVADSADQTTYAEAYRNAVRDSGLSAKEYRDIVAVKALENKIRQNIVSGIPATADQVRLFEIQVGTQEEAQQVVDRLAAGEDFSAIAAELSLDSNTKDKGGEMGWTPKAALETAAGDAVFALEVGQWTQPVAASNNSYYVYKVSDKASAMELTADQQKAIEDQTFADQQAKVSAETTIERPYLPMYSDLWNKLADYALKNGAGTAAGQ
jgi:parvulin-like peptidyl-prolyl isomerase